MCFVYICMYFDLVALLYCFRIYIAIFECYILYSNIRLFIFVSASTTKDTIARLSHFKVFGFLLLAVTNLLAFASASCNTFTVDEYGVTNASTFTSVGRSFVVSAGVVCTANTSCVLEPGGYVTVARTVNISSSDSDELFATMSSRDQSTVQHITHRRNPNRKVGHHDGTDSGRIHGLQTQYGMHEGNSLRVLRRRG